VVAGFEVRASGRGPMAKEWAKPKVTLVKFSCMRLCAQCLTLLLCSPVPEHNKLSFAFKT